MHTYRLIGLFMVTTWLFILNFASNGDVWLALLGHPLPFACVAAIIMFRSRHKISHRQLTKMRRLRRWMVDKTTLENVYFATKLTSKFFFYLSTCCFFLFLHAKIYMLASIILREIAISSSNA